VLISVVALFFHVAGAVLNDVADLPFDRRNPSRAHSPLVAGSVQPLTAIIVACVAVAAAFMADVSSRSQLCGRTIALAIAFAGLVGYDFLGKRALVPPLTDALQGVGWAALLYYSAFSSGSPSTITLLAAIYMVIATMIINGVHGALRDLGPDYDYGARTTAIFFGARVGPTGLIIPNALARYAWMLQLALVGVVIIAVVDGLPAGFTGWCTAVMAVALTGLAAMLLRRWLCSLHRRSGLQITGGAEILATFGGAASLASVRSGPGWPIAVLIVMMLPLIIRRLTKNVFKSLDNE
jgi:4-hydroxybenzoate polyprenyltransferase